jgi:hypothetical protein
MNDSYMPTIEVFEAMLADKGGRADEGADFAQKAFDARLQWLQSRGVKVQRYALPSDGSALFMNSAVKSAFEAHGPDCLPMVVVHETIVSVGGYPTPTELVDAAGEFGASDPEFLGDVAVETAALGAAIAANAFESFQQTWERLRLLGVRDADLIRAVQSVTATAGIAVRDDLRTRVEQFLAFGPQGKPPKPRCSCANQE